MNQLALILTLTAALFGDYSQQCDERAWEARSDQYLWSMRESMRRAGRVHVKREPYFWSDEELLREAKR